MIMCDCSRSGRSPPVAWSTIQHDVIWLDVLLHRETLYHTATRIASHNNNTNNDTNDNSNTTNADTNTNTNTNTYLS